MTAAITGPLTTSGAIVPPSPIMLPAFSLLIVVWGVVVAPVSASVVMVVVTMTVVGSVFAVATGGGIVGVAISGASGRKSKQK